MWNSRVITIAFVGALLLSACGALLLSACGAKAQEGVLVYKATMPDGSVPEYKLLDRVTTKLELRLTDAGLQRKSAGVVPPDTIRVIIPESAVGRIDELRAVLEDPAELPVRLEFLRQGE
jgi:hypothetical protein